MKRVVIIPAKRHSSFENKNIRMLLGKPLIQYTIWAALDSNAEEIIVSTDYSATARIAKENGCTVHERDPSLCLDHTTSDEVIENVLEFLYKRDKSYPEQFIYMQVTDVIRPLNAVNNLCNMMDRYDIDSAFFSYATHKHYWNFQNDILVDINPNPKVARQQGLSIYREDTGIGCITKTETFLKEGTRVCGKKGMVVNDDPMSMIDIHTQEDLDLAAFVIHSDIAKAKDYKYYHEYSFNEKTRWQKT